MKQLRTHLFHVTSPLSPPQARNASLASGASSNLSPGASSNASAALHPGGGEPALAAARLASGGTSWQTHVPKEQLDALHNLWSNYEVAFRRAGALDVVAALGACAFPSSVCRLENTAGSFDSARARVLLSH